MKKLTTVLLSLLVISIISAGIVAAYGMGFGGRDRGTNAATGVNAVAPGTHHEQMSKIFDSGSYQDLVKYRTASGFNVMPWVQNQQDFELAKQMHEKMEKYHEENNIPYGAGKGRRGAGCPMRNAQISQ